ncbi:MAG: DUF104 domain-containing protein [Synechococcaceae cyanobacterium SM2_3_1]|nr:DUF104 domain-containing protein [Synechococcaceae cyanobacterium SM2_3_1]
MSQTIAAIFEKGVLYPEEPLELEEGTRVKITRAIYLAKTGTGSGSGFFSFRA